MSERRYPPSAKALREARARGDLPRAPLLARAGSLVGALAGLWLAGGGVARALSLGERAFSLDGSSWSALPGLAVVGLAGLGGAALGALGLGSLAGGVVFAPRAPRVGGQLPGGRLGRGEFWIWIALWASLALGAVWLWAELLRGRPWREVAGYALGGLVGAGALQAVAARWLYLRRFRRELAQVRRDQREESGDPRARASLRALVREATQPPSPGRRPKTP